MRRVNQQQLRKRKETIIDAAMLLAQEPGGWSKLTRGGIALRAGCSDALVSNYLGSMIDIRETLLKTAMKQENYAVIHQAWAAGEKFPKHIKVAMFEHLTSHA
jgi:AcrR family transcriptional regulator